MSLLALFVDFIFFNFIFLGFVFNPGYPYNFKYLVIFNFTVYDIFSAYACNAKSFAMVIIFNLFFFSAANMNGLEKVASLVFSIVVQVTCGQYWFY